MFYVPSNSVSVILGEWEGENEKLCGTKCSLASERISPLAEFKPATLWSLSGALTVRPH